MMATSGRLYDRRAHHRGWFKLYLFGGGVEVWFGNRWFMVSR